MSYQYVKCPSFIRKDPNTGELLEILCKLCGSVIAAKTERIIRYDTDRQGNRVKVVRDQFTRFSNYAEIKISFVGDDEYFHITHGCTKCLNTGLSVDVLTELHQADQEESPDGYTDRERARVPIKVEALRNDGGGMS